MWEDVSGCGWMRVGASGRGAWAGLAWNGLLLLVLLIVILGTVCSGFAPPMRASLLCAVGLAGPRACIPVCGTC